LLSCSASSCLHALLKSVTPLHCHREGCDVNRTLKLPFSCLTNLRSPNKLENIGLHSLLKFIFLSFSISSHCRFIPEELCHLTKPHLPVIPPTTPPAPPDTPTNSKPSSSIHLNPFLPNILLAVVRRFRTSAPVPAPFRSSQLRILRTTSSFPAAVPLWSRHTIYLISISQQPSPNIPLAHPTVPLPAYYPHTAR
jgi:hypothetical protein